MPSDARPWQKRFEVSADTRIEPFRIGLVAASLTGNKGAAAMAVAAIEGLTERLPPGTRFMLFSLYPRRDRACNRYGNVTVVPASPLHSVVILPIISIALSILRRMHFPTALPVRLYGPLRAMLSCDLILDLSGISFVVGRPAGLLFNVSTIVSPVVLGIPCIKLSQAFGPLGGGPNRAAARMLLRRLTAVFPRGDVSASHLASAGIDTESVSPDLAFTLQSPERAVAGEGASPRIAVIPSEVMRRRCGKLGIDYPGEMADFCSAASIEFGAEIVLVAHSNLGAEIRSHNNDYQVCREIIDRIGSSARVTAVLDELGPEELRSVIASCSIAVSSRFHGMVSALASGMPVIATAWSHKYLEVMKSFGMQDFVVAARDISCGRLLPLARSLLSDSCSISRRVAGFAQAVRSAANVQLDYVADYLQHSAFPSRGRGRAIPPRFLPDGCEPDIRLGFSMDPATISKRASGGLVTALLGQRISSGASKGAAVASCRVDGGSLKLETRLVTSPGEAGASAGSIYGWFPHLAGVLGILRSSAGPVDVVLLPCQAAALRRLATRDEEIRRNLGLIISLWCGHASGKSLADHLMQRWTRKAGTRAVSFRYRTGLWRGRSELGLENGDVIGVPFSKGFGLFQNLHADCRMTCLACRDQLGRASDISFGDAWIPTVRYSVNKKSMAMALTADGREALDRLCRSGVIISRPAGGDLVMAAQGRSLAWHDRSPTRAAVAPLFGYRLPGERKLSIRHLPAALMELSLVRSFDSPLRGLLLSCPWWALMPDLLALKALQTIAAIGGR